jgi:hypothetical protein
MSEFATAADGALQLAQWAVPITVFGVVMYQLGRISGGAYRTSSKTPTTEQAHRKLHEGSFTLITEPGETRGTGIREMEHGIDLLKIKADEDGDYYRDSYFSIYDAELTEIAEQFSIYAEERQRDTNQSDMREVISND